MTLIAATLRLALLLLAGCLPAYGLIAGRLAPGPVVLILVVAGLLGWYEWGHLSLPRAALGESHRQLRDWLELFAHLVGVRLRDVTVVEAEAGCLEVPEALNRRGEVVYASGDLAAHGLSHHLAQAARQFAVINSPPRWGWPGIAATGLGLGVVMGLQARYPRSLWVALAAVAAAIGLAATVIGLGTSRGELRAGEIEDRAREYLGLMRDRHPDAFADLSARQGLGPGGPPRGAGAPKACGPATGAAPEALPGAGGFRPPHDGLHT